MSDKRYTNLEITLMFDEIKSKLEEHGKTHKEILDQVTFTNGKVKLITKWLLILGSVSATLLVTNGSETISILKLFI